MGGEEAAKGVDRSSVGAGSYIALTSNVCKVMAREERHVGGILV